MLGIALVAVPVAGLTALAVWLIAALLTRYSSISGMAAALAVPGAAWTLGERDWPLVTTLLAVILIARHHENIRRLLNGTESRIGAK